jgi:hypothetical protein
VAAASVTTILAGCAVDPAAQRSAAESVAACILKKARLLDDHASDAMSIAVAVRAACSTETRTWIDAMQPQLSTYEADARITAKINEWVLTTAEKEVLEERTGNQ